MKKRLIYPILGLAILVFMLISYFIEIVVDSGSNFVTYDKLLGIVIFHSPLVLGIYFFLALFLIFIGLKKPKVKMRKGYK